MSLPHDAAQVFGNVIDPVFGKPMLEIGSLSNVRVESEKVFARVKLSTPSPRAREEIASRLAEAARARNLSVPEIEWETYVPAREVRSDDPLPSVRNIVLVMSGKGGVGKSTIATNLAVGWARLGVRVGLLDADVYGPSVPTMLGVEGHPASEDGKTITPLERFGVKLMSIGFLLDDPRQAIIWRGPMLHGALQQFLTEVAWGELDYLVIDLPPGTGDVAITIAQKLPGTTAVLVTTPQEVALQDVYKGVSMCQKLEIPILGVVENMSYFVDSAGVKHAIFGSGGGAKVAEFAHAPLLASIPIDATVTEWGDKGTPVVKSAPGSVAGNALLALAEILAERIARHHFEHGGATHVPAAAGPKRLRVLS